MADPTTTNSQIDAFISFLQHGVHPSVMMRLQGEAKALEDLVFNRFGSEPILDEDWEDHDRDFAELKRAQTRLGRMQLFVLEKELKIAKKVTYAEFGKLMNRWPGQPRPYNTFEMGQWKFDRIPHEEAEKKQKELETAIKKLKQELNM